MKIPNEFNGYNADGRRLYFKGGDGGAGAARQQEEDRQARIRAATETVNGVFNSSNRDALYGSHKQAVYDLNATDVNKQYEEAERQNRFGLARNGLLGGSTDVDSNAQLQEKTNEGLMKATGVADQAAANLKTADERTRQGLISMAQSGIDTGTAQTMALRNLDATAQSASAQRQGASIGGLFNDLSQAYLMRSALAGQRAGAAPGQQQWSGVSAPQQTYAGT